LKRVSYRICHLAKYYPPVPGGIETHIQTLARTQAELGSNVKVICVNGTDVQGCDSITTPTVQENDGRVDIVRLGRLTSVARFDVLRLDCLQQFWRLFSDRYDVVHIHTPNPTMLLAWLMISVLAAIARRPPVTLIVTHHSDIVKQQVLKYALRPIEYLVYQQASSILTTSVDYIAGSKFLRAFPAKVSALPLGLDCQPFLEPNEMASTYSTQFQQTYGNTPLWLAVGRLVYYKAFHIAIEALTQVPGMLMIVGVGPLEKKLKTFAKSLNVSDRVIWYGRANVDELVGAYHAATALWLTSNVRSEGFGIVQIEAMASGCPVINTAIPCSGVSWVSRHDQEGLTVPINDPLAVSSAAQRLLTEPGLRERLAIAGQERVLKEFGHTLMAEKSLSIYRQSMLDNSTKGTLKPLLLKRGLWTR
jgi:glycosyltransferase involved in cell wall biosynthesis